MRKILSLVARLLDDGRFAQNLPFPNGIGGFDPDFYLEQNPDVAASRINPFVHFMTIGWREGRDPSADFSLAAYCAAHTEVEASGVNPFQHFLEARLAAPPPGVSASDAIDAQTEIAALRQYSERLALQLHTAHAQYAAALSSAKALRAELENARNCDVDAPSVLPVRSGPAPFGASSGRAGEAL
jgi:hypothetical protein